MTLAEISQAFVAAVSAGLLLGLFSSFLTKGRG